MRKMIKVMLILLTGVVLFTGCDEVETTTEIHKDGSCTRSVKLDSSDIADTPYPLPESVGWDILYTRNDGDQSIYNASRLFNRVDDLARDLQNSTKDGKKILITPKLEKRFRWFYTYYRYSEVFSSIKTRFIIPPEDYFTPDEIALLSNSSDSVKNNDELNDKFEEWITRNFFESFYQSFEETVNQLGDTDLSVGLLQSKKEDLFQVLFKDELVSLDDENDTLTDKDMEILSKTLGTTAIAQIRTELDTIIAGLMRELEWLASIQLTDFNQIVIMPGLIIDTNAKTVNGTKVTWDVDSNILFFKNYKMWVESRIVNRGVIIGSLVLVLLLITLLVVSSVRKRYL